MKRVRQPTRWLVWRRLHVRAALMAAPLLLGLGAAMYFLLQHYSAQTSLEAGQRMNLGLARYHVSDHHYRRREVPSDQRACVEVVDERPLAELVHRNMPFGVAKKGEPTAGVEQRAVADLVAGLRRRL